MPETTLSAFTNVGADRRIEDRGRLHNRIVKAAGYPVAGILAVLLLTAALPPIVADQSDRAILDAPVSLLTTPISGEVSNIKVSVGARVTAAAPVADVSNTRVDQTTLMSLKGRSDTLREAYETARAENAADENYLAVLDREIAVQKAQLIKQYSEKVAALKADAGSATASYGEKKAIHDQQTFLLAHGDVSEGMVKPVTQQMAAANSIRVSATAQLAALTTQLDSIRNNVFIGDDLTGIAAIAQKRRDVAFDAISKAIEEKQAKAALDSALILVGQEQARVASLQKISLAAPAREELLHINAAPGRHVNAGDALATFVNCKSLFAVAIFSYRQASALAVGTHMTISGGAEPVSGTVQDIIPKSDERTDELYAVSFPQTERREMYVVVKPDDIDALRPRDREGAPEGSCPVGKWITVTRADGWIPSSSVIWHKISQLAMSTTAAIAALDIGHWGANL